MPVPGIRISNRPKTGRLVRFASLDRFIVIKNIFFMPKRSRLVRKCPVRISNGRTKWRPFCFYHLKTGLFRPDFEWSTSLDRFIKKRVMNKIFFMPKRSRLVRKISGPDFKWYPKTGHKLCPRNDHSNTGRFGIRMLLYMYLITGIPDKLTVGYLDS